MRNRRWQGRRWEDCGGGGGTVEEVGRLWRRWEDCGGGGTSALKTGSFASTVSSCAWSEENIYVKKPKKIKVQLVIVG